jgi:alkanesulfonate monooxygenase SsuD/methylene tetrahydromethanopterin reductase-like flavin-dependent oxidoreductase (luciferase family)
MHVGVGVDPAQGLSEADESSLLRHAAELGYESAWTPSGPDAAAFDRCLRRYQESGLATGISVVPASGRPPSFYASHAVRVWEATGGRFVLGVGSGEMDKPAMSMREYLSQLRDLRPSGLPVYVGAMVLRVAGEAGDGAALNWCSKEQVQDARIEVTNSAAGAHRPVPSSSNTSAPWSILMSRWPERRSPPPCWRARSARRSTEGISSGRDSPTS